MKIKTKNEDSEEDHDDAGNNAGCGAVIATPSLWMKMKVMSDDATMDEDVGDEEGQ